MWPGSDRPVSVCGRAVDAARKGAVYGRAVDTARIVTVVYGRAVNSSTETDFFGEKYFGG